MKKGATSVISEAKFVLMDTASINHASDKPESVEVKDLVGIFRSGDWIPFITYHQLEEIACHEDEDVFKRRWAFLAELRLVGFLRQSGEQANVGSTMDLRNCEVEFLISNPGASHQDIIEGVYSKVRSGFCSGSEFAASNFEWWQYFQRFLAEDARKRKSKIVNLTHFPLADVSEPFDSPNIVPARGAEDARNQFAALARQLEQRIVESGDNRNLDPELAAKQFMQESFEDLQPIPKDSKEWAEAIMSKYGVKRSRLPKKPTLDDVGYESIFVAQMAINAKNLLIDKDELLNLVRKEELPSWVVWQALDKRLKKLPKAEIGNLNDKHVAPFGLYVEVINVDKRIAEMLRQAGRQSELLRRIHARVPKQRGFLGLVNALTNSTSNP